LEGAGSCGKREEGRKEKKRWCPHVGTFREEEKESIFAWKKGKGQVKGPAQLARGEEATRGKKEKGNFFLLNTLYD